MWSDKARESSIEEKKRKAKVGCSVEGCDKQHQAKGYCNFHYLRFRRDRLRLQTEAQRKLGQNEGISEGSLRAQIGFRKEVSKEGSVL